MDAYTIVTATGSVARTTIGPFGVHVRDDAPGDSFDSLGRIFRPSGNFVLGHRLPQYRDLAHKLI
jgi:hypothetical protein